MADEHPHRWLEYAPSDRTHCAGKCKKLIHHGYKCDVSNVGLEFLMSFVRELRFGTKFRIQDHDSITWRCLGCVTHQQAENIRNVAAEHKQTVHSFLTVPPVDAHGPSEPVVATFIDYLEALHVQDETKTKELLEKLNRVRKVDGEEHDVPGDNDNCGDKNSPKKGKKRDKDEVDLHELDAQICDDPDMLKMFAVDDLRSLCVHHGLDDSGTASAMKDRLTDFYDGKKMKI